MADWAGLSHNFQTWYGAFGLGAERYMVGSRHRILTRTGVDAWTLSFNPNGLDAFNTVAGVSPDDLYAAGFETTDAVLYTWRPALSTWERLTTLPTVIHNVKAMTFISASEWYLVGIDSQQQPLVLRGVR